MRFLQKIKFFLLRKFSKIIITGIVKSCKVIIWGQNHVTRMRKEKKPIIYAVWHRHLFVPIQMFKNSGVRPLISLSTDGEIVAQIAEEFGTFPIRGSSSKGGAVAFLKLLKSIKQTSDEIFITADGPKGPLREIKEGMIMLAQKTGAAIIPICWVASRVKILTKTWDQFLIPLPFSTIHYIYGRPFTVPAEGGKIDLSSSRAELESIMIKMENDLETGRNPHRIVD